MEIQVIDAGRLVNESKNTEYLVATMRAGKHQATVTVCRGATSYIRVVVNNAANRAWRGMGKSFETLEAAVAGYKTQAVRDMIEHAYAMG